MLNYHQLTSAHLCLCVHHAGTPQGQMCTGYPGFNPEEVIVNCLIVFLFPRDEMELGGDPYVRRQKQHGEVQSLHVAPELELMSL